jgi:hypothetical protein
MRYAPQRRRRLLFPITAGFVAALLGFVWKGVTSSIQTPEVAPAAVLARPEFAEKARYNADVFATVDDLALELPYPDPVAVAFHEASKPEALRLEPNGRILANDNPTKFAAREDHRGPAYRVLSSRGRARPATSAVDIVVPVGSLIRSPVTGRVVEVRQYPLYNRGLDWRIAITPDSHPDLQVVLIHLEQPRVEPGDTVVAGVTPLAAVRLLEFASHVDYVIEQHKPHTHIEVKRVPDEEPQQEPLDPDTRAVAQSHASEEDRRPGQTAKSGH